MQQWRLSRRPSAPSRGGGGRRPWHSGGGRARWRPAATLVASVVALALASGPALAAPSVSSTPDGSWSVDGRVYATAIVGDTVLVGGAFTAASGPGGERVARRNLAAFRLSTGELIQSWKADAGSTVRALEVSGEWVYVGGAFNRVGGVPNDRLARVRVADAHVDRGFSASLDAPVRALDAVGGTLWVGGAFATVNGQARSRVAAVNAVTGALDPTFRATPSGDVWGIVKHPSRPVVYVAGNFASVSGVTRTGVAALSTTGAVEPIVFASSARPTLGLDLDASGTMLYGAGGSGTNTMAAWSTVTGARVWRHVVMGDVQAVTHHDGQVWFGFHDGYQNNTDTKVLVAQASTGALVADYRPRFDQFWGVFAIGVSEAGVVLGGDFTRVSGIQAQGWTRFLAAQASPVDPPVDPPVEPPVEPPAVPVQLTADTAWSYWDRGTRPSGWENRGFDDSAWARGLGEFGYGDGDERTVVKPGVIDGRRSMTAYFRTSFTVPVVGTGARLELLADDGAVVYVNGVEVGRDNMPAGAITHDTAAASNRSGSAELRYATFTVPASALRSGLNVVAVEVHQDQRGSSDLSFAATMTTLH